MMRKLGYLVVLAVVLLLNACSNGNSDSPNDNGNGAHPRGWFDSHSAKALDAPDFINCTGCHGGELKGSGDAVSCYSCHSYNTKPPFSYHPPTWADAFSAHGAYAAQNGFDSCNACHGDDLKGQGKAVSCYSCHSFNSAPPLSVHPPGWTDTFSDHGDFANENGITACTACHGDDLHGRAEAVSCYRCHSFNTAPPLSVHPPAWTDPYTQHSAFVKENGYGSCTACHGEELQGQGAAVSCSSCHPFNPEPPISIHPPDWTDTFSDHGDYARVNGAVSCTACHGVDLQGSSVAPGCYTCHSFNTAPPFSVHPPGWTSTFAEHGDFAKANGIESCANCHGTNLSGRGNAIGCYSCHLFNTAPPFSIHPPDWTDAYIEHRDFAAENGTYQCKICHGVNLLGRPPAPSCFSSGVDGRACHADGPGQAPHPLDRSYLDGINHGPDAREDLIACQGCHGQPGGPGSNPRFNLGIENAGGRGCEGCHSDFYAHPQDWAGPQLPAHNLAGNIQNACSLCHGVMLDGVGGVGVSCLDCHNVSPGAYPTDCVSCHGAPPNGGSPVGSSFPNRAGQHGRVGHSRSISATPANTCDRCHSGAGSGTEAHFDQAPPADVTLPRLDLLDTIEPQWDGGNVTCNGSCHLGGYDFNHVDKNWY